KPVKSLELKSKWTSSCVESQRDAGNFGLMAKIEAYEFSAGLMKTTVLFHETSCQAGLVQINELGRYELGVKVADNTYALNEYFDSVSVTPLTEDGAKALNSIIACGFTDWKESVPKIVTQQSSNNPIAARCWQQTPRNVYDLVLISETE